MFKTGDIVEKIKRIKGVIDGFPSYLEDTTDIIGRVLTCDLNRNVIVFDIIVINGHIKFERTEVYNIFRFRLVDDDTKIAFDKHINSRSEEQDHLYLDFIKSYRKMNEETKHKVIEYILIN